MKIKKIGFTIGKFAPLHKGHQLLIETALNEMDEFYVVVYDTNLIDVDIKKRAKWIRKKYPSIHILYAYNSPKKYGLDEESVEVQMKYLSNIMQGIPVTHFYSSEQYGKKVAEYLNIKNRVIDIERNTFPISSKQIREDYYKNKEYLEENVFNDCINNKK